MSSLFERLGIKLEGGMKSEVTEVIPSNILPLDIALGVGGLPRGRIVTLVGQYSTGKTTLAALLAANNQKLGGTTLVFDTEAVYERYWLERVGVDMTRGDVVVLQTQEVKTKEGKEVWPLTMEYIGKLLVDVLRAATPDDKLLIIWDTVSSTPVDAELEGKVSQEKLIGKHARVLSFIFRVLPELLLEKKATLLCIAQPKTDPLTGATDFLGSKPLRFHASIVIELSRYSKDETKQVVKFVVTKNKVASPYKSGTYTYYFGYGVDFISSLPAFVGKSTSHYTWNGKSVLRKKSLELLIDPTLKSDIEKWVTQQLERKIPYKILLDERTFTSMEEVTSTHTDEVTGGVIEEPEGGGEV